MKKSVSLFLTLLMLLSCFGALADDGFHTSYTYTYDYWEEVQESPDAYKVANVVDR